MRYRFFRIALVSLFPFLAGTASAEEPRALLERAIKAHGGADRLERTKKGHLQARIEVTKPNNSFTYEIEEWFNLPSRYKQIAHFKESSTSFQRELAYAGEVGWSRKGTDPVRNLRRDSFSLTEHWYAVLAQLLLLREKDVQLKALPEQMSDGRTLTGIHAVYSQLPGDFFFDRSTALLHRSKAIKPNSPDSVEIIYDNYRDIQGVFYPMCFKVTEKTYSSTVTLSSIEFLDKIDDSVFLKPPRQAAEEWVVEAPTNDIDEKTRASRHRTLIVATVGAGVAIGAAWFIVRASKRGKRETPPS